MEFVVELLYTIYLARRDFRFYHGDLHPNNIMYRKLPHRDKRIVRSFILGGYEFTVASPFVPVMIDFEKSMFGEPGELGRQKEGLSDVRHIIISAGEILKTLGLKETNEYREVRNWVLSAEFNRIDNRFRPETIVELLTTHDLFEFARDELEGDEEPDTKKVKGCMHCNAPLAAVQCISCRATFCSERCADQSWNKINCHLG
jgi:hypothetical protein